MEVEARGIRAEFDLRLVEEAVLLATDALQREERDVFRGERDPIYGVSDRGERDARFRRLHEAWFVRLGLAERVFRLLAEQPEIRESVSRTVVLYALSAKEEGADLHELRGRLHGPKAAPPVLVVRIRPRSLLEWHGFAPELRRELLHVADMLDPRFAYDPARRIAGEGPAQETLGLSRFRVLWDTSVDGRLSSRGLLPNGGEEMRRREFLKAFGRLSPLAEEAFHRYFGGPRPTHEEMLTLASHLPEDLTGGLPTEGMRSAASGSAAAPGAPGARGVGTSSRCPLCRFPTTSFHPDPAGLGPDVLAILRVDFPAWEPAQTICIQCADLYSARVSTWA